MKSLCFLLAVLTFCSGRFFPPGRIINGNEATPGQFPYQVLLNMNVEGQVEIYGGSLISSRYILTAAHSLAMATDGFALLGAHSRIDPEEHQVRVDLTRADFIIHEDYYGRMARNDIGLVRLPVEVAFSGYIQPVKLPRWSDGGFTGYTGTIAGWGTTEEPSTGYSRVLNYVTNPIYSNEQCMEAFYWPYFVEEQNVCMSGKGQRSACIGDSGGPVTVQVVGGDVIQIGVFSFGPHSHCLEEIPIICARTSYYLGWIQAHSDVVIEA